MCFRWKRNSEESAKVINCCKEAMSDKRRWYFSIWFVALILTTPPLTAYSVLSHEQLIDIAWESDIRPVLIRRFPNTTHEELKEAHAFAYGGSVIHDLGYYLLRD